MKKQYSKKQITEAIAYWKDQLKQMNESVKYPQYNDNGFPVKTQRIGYQIQCKREDEKEWENFYTLHGKFAQYDDKQEAIEVAHDMQAYFSDKRMPNKLYSNAIFRVISVTVNTTYDIVEQPNAMNEAEEDAVQPKSKFGETAAVVDLNAPTKAKIVKCTSLTDLRKAIKGTAVVGIYGPEESDTEVIIYPLDFYTDSTAIDSLEKFKDTIRNDIAPTEVIA